VWAKAFDAWISHFRAKKTVEAYLDAWRYFIEYAQIPPWKAGRAVMVDWHNEMQSRGLAHATIQLRLAALWQVIP
jgi:hypothetical protein